MKEFETLLSPLSPLSSLLYTISSLSFLLSLLSFLLSPLSSLLSLSSPLSSFSSLLSSLHVDLGRFNGCLFRSGDKGNKKDKKESHSFLCSPLKHWKESHGIACWRGGTTVAITWRNIVGVSLKRTRIGSFSRRPKKKEGEERDASTSFLFFYFPSYLSSSSDSIAERKKNPEL
jgi:hypothetical protein